MALALKRLGRYFYNAAAAFAAGSFGYVSLCPNRHKFNRTNSVRIRDLKSDWVSQSNFEADNLPMDDFKQVIQRVCGEVIRSLESGTTLSERLKQEVDAVYIKSVEGKILMSNRAYETMFSDEKLTLGRPGSSYLTDSVQEVARLSDNMLLTGCQVIQFDHVGHDSAGRDVRFRTYKRSLLGMGHPTMAIMGVTRLLEVIGNSGVIRLNTLKDQWKSFSQLDDFDRAIAIGLGRGISVGDIAAEHNVTKKTIENHRAAILKALKLNSPVELIKLVVRLQENGFGDFGV